MRIPLTKYGWPEVVVLPAGCLAVMLILLVLGPNFLPGSFILVTEIVLLAVLIWLLAFFRDPERAVPQNTNILLAPADGKITDIEIVQVDSFIVGKALRIGIFMNIFNVHVNRSPCPVTVEKIIYRKGRFKNAMGPASGRVNESNDLFLLRLDEPRDKLLVRQISGAIARRIVCTAKQGQNLAGGEKFGMVKFGSRAELYLPVRENVKCLVKVGDNVKAGLTILVKYERT